MRTYWCVFMELDVDTYMPLNKKLKTNVYVNYDFFSECCEMFDMHIHLNKELLTTTTTSMKLGHRYGIKTCDMWEM